MKRATQNMLYHLLPAIFWLLAISGSVVPIILNLSTFNIQLSTYYWGFLVAVLALLSVYLISRIQRHSSSVEECFQVALLLGIAAYWLPSVLFLILPIWGYLIYQNLFSLRSFIATLLGVAAVLVWVLALAFLWPDTFHLSSISANLSYWIQTGAFVAAWLASFIARRELRVR